jgi:hypothetical protein
MKQRFITAVLLSSIIAFAVASWGRVVEWWEDMSPGWKSGVFMFCWALLILIGYRYGPYYALAALIAGLMFMAVQIGILIREMLNLIENNEKD